MVGKGAAATTHDVDSANGTLKTLFGGQRQQKSWMLGSGAPVRPTPRSNTVRDSVAQAAQIAGSNILASPISNKSTSASPVTTHKSIERRGSLQQARRKSSTSGPAASRQSPSKRLSTSEASTHPTTAENPISPVLPRESLNHQATVHNPSAQVELSLELPTVSELPTYRTTESISSGLPTVSDKVACQSKQTKSAALFPRAISTGKASDNSVSGGSSEPQVMNPSFPSHDGQANIRRASLVRAGTSVHDAIPIDSQEVGMDDSHDTEVSDSRRLSSPMMLESPEPEPRTISLPPLPSSVLLSPDQHYLRLQSPTMQSPIGSGASRSMPTLALQSPPHGEAREVSRRTISPTLHLAAITENWRAWSDSTRNTNLVSENTSVGNANGQLSPIIPISAHRRESGILPLPSQIHSNTSPHLSSRMSPLSNGPSQAIALPSTLLPNRPPQMIASSGPMTSLQRAQSRSSASPRNTAMPSPRLPHEQQNSSYSTLSNNPAKRQRLQSTMMLEPKLALIESHLKSVGGEASLNMALERPRFQLLKDACVNEDLFYVVLHQLYLVWDTNRGEVVHIDLPGFPKQDILTEAFKIVGSLIRQNEALAPIHKTWFAKFPSPLSSLIQVSSWYRDVLQQVGVFLRKLAANWLQLKYEHGKRGYPVLVDELVHRLGLISPVLQGVVFTASRRDIGIGDGPIALQIESLFKKDQRDHQKMADRLQTNRPPTEKEVTERNNILSTQYHSLCQQSGQQYQRRVSGSVAVQQPSNQPPSNGYAQNATSTNPMMMSRAQQGGQQGFGAQNMHSPDVAGNLQFPNTQVQNSRGSPNIPLVDSRSSIGQYPQTSRNSPNPSLIAARSNSIGNAHPHTNTPSPTLVQGLTMQSPDQANFQFAPVVRSNSGSIHPTGHYVNPQYANGPYLNSPQSTIPSQFQRAQYTQQVQQQQQQQQQMFMAQQAAQQQPHLIAQHQVTAQTARLQQNLASQGYQPQSIPAQYQQGPVAISPQAQQFPMSHVQQNMSARQQNQQIAYQTERIRQNLGQQGAQRQPHPTNQQAVPTRQTSQTQVAQQQALGMNAAARGLSVNELARLRNNSLNSTNTRGPSSTALQIPQPLGSTPNPLPADLDKNDIQDYISTDRLRRRLVPPLNYQHGPQIMAHGSEITALHQATIRSPRLVPVDFNVTDKTQSDPETRRYQAVRSLAVAPTRLSGIPITKFEFTISQADLIRIPNDKISNNGQTSVREILRGSLQYRIRCVNRKRADAQCSLFDWMVAESSWPESACLEMNGKQLQLRRKTHHAKDLPIDITQLVRANGAKYPNKLTLSMIRNRTKVKESGYFLAVEVIEILSHQDILATCQRNRIPAEVTLYKIKKSLAPPATDDDDFAMIASDISIDLADPFSSSIYTIPVRGANCLHRECFDLSNFLTTRPSKPKHHQQPSVPDQWKCPLCNLDARPSALRIDGFLEDVRTGLARMGKLDTKGILVKADGSWYPKIEKRKATDEPSTGQGLGNGAGYESDEGSGSDGDGAIMRAAAVRERAQEVIVLD